MFSLYHVLHISMKDFENEFQRLLGENRMKIRHTYKQKIIFGLFNIFYLGYKNKYFTKLSIL